MSLKECEERFGVDHFRTLLNVGILGSILTDGGKYSEAEAMNRRALAGREKELGSNHPSTLTSVYCLAHLLAAIEHHDEATRLYERACAGFECTLGASHPTSVACRQHFTSLLSQTSQSPPQW